MAGIDLLAEAGAKQIVGFLGDRACSAASESPDFNTWWPTAGNLQYLVAPRNPYIPTTCRFFRPDYLVALDFR
jgi:hypothetical protein